MDFFKQQDISRTKTSWLIALFTLAVIAVTLAVYGVALTIVFFHRARQPGFAGQPFDVIQPELGLWVIGITLLIIFIGSLTKIVALAKGGPAVAENLGGRLVHAASTDVDERKLLNVVEEMALASGTPVPQVYILDREKGINAFAAGYSINDAIVAVTPSCLTLLKRDELQGVIAHEFSHILNGDMRLNIRLIGLLSGIMVLANIGYLILRSRTGSRKSGAQIVLVGLGLLIIGSIGHLFGRIIQAAVSRQREYFADASAVQFTRNPGGIAGALKKIGGFKLGSRIRSPYAGEICHMFVAKAVGTLFATHPPLADRVQRLDPVFDGRFEPLKIPDSKTPPPTAPRVKPTAEPAAAFTAGVGTVINRPGDITARGIDHSQELLKVIPADIRAELSDILGAMAVTCLLLLDEDPQIRDIQMKRLQKRAPGKLMRHLADLEVRFKTLDLQLRLPILDLALPVLRQMSAGQYAKFKTFVQILVEADARLSFFEFALQQILLHRLEANFKRPKKEIVYRSISALALETVHILSRLAHVGHRREVAAQAAFNCGWARLNITDPRWKMQPADKVSFGVLRIALQRFATASPGVKKNLLDACAHCVLHDERVTLEEAELVRAVAYALDIPLPPFLDVSLN
ncbi:MAG: M48 family metallopeptidase [Deltaproteobacteria bacterium]|jgi:Zn-dependent protease with chaperone function|nr:M48 family metallopeptidase [Deltaproteobacteria bacterium]